MAETAVLSPDPATNSSMPESTFNEMPDEWSDLELPEEPPNDPLEFEEDEGQTAAAETETEPVAETTEAAPAAEDAAATEIPEDVQKKVEGFEFFDRAVRENPGALAEQLLGKLDPLERAQLLGKYGVNAETAAFDVSAYEAQSDMEDAIKSRWESIDSIPHIAQSVKNVKEYSEQQIGDMVPQVAYGNVMAEVSLAKIDAICEAFGLALSDPDMAAIEKHLQAGNVSYRDAVRKSLDYKKAVESAKQARAQRPTTPRNETRRPEPIPEGTDAVTIARRLGTIGNGRR